MDIIEVEESPPVKLKKTVKRKKSRSINHSVTSSAGSKKKHIHTSDESDIGNDVEVSGSKYSPSEPLDYYYDEETVVVESPKCKKKQKNMKCKVPVKKKKQEKNDESSDEESSSPPEKKYKKKKKWASPPPPSVPTAAAAAGVPLQVSGQPAHQTVTVDIQQIVDFVK